MALNLLWKKIRKLQIYGAQFSSPHSPLISHSLEEFSVLFLFLFLFLYFASCMCHCTYMTCVYTHTHIYAYTRVLLYSLKTHMPGVLLVAQFCSLVKSRRSQARAQAENRCWHLPRGSGSLICLTLSQPLLILYRNSWYLVD